MDIRIQGGQVLSGEITPSGRKNSIVALIPASILFDKPVTFTNVPDITDVDRLVTILTGMGSKITWDKTSQTMTLDHSSLKYDPLEKSDLQGSSSKGIRGTTLLWGPLLARFKKAESAEQPAGCTLGARPIDAHYQAFLDLGVTVQTSGNQIILDAKSAKNGPIWLLEASPTATENAICLAVSLPGTTTITHAASEPNVQQLCIWLNACGAHIEGIGSSVLVIEGGKALSPVPCEVISDLEEIATFLALTAATGGELKIHKAHPEYFVGINREFAKFGITVSYEGTTAVMKAGQKPVITKTKSPMIVRSQPWPGLPVDMLPLFIPLALAAPSGQALFHNWMYEAGLFWTSELLKLGANVTMCDPHRVIVTGGNKLTGSELDAPYIIRATISLVMSAMIASGESVIKNADSIHRAHPRFVENLKSLGAKIEEI